uniref:MCF.2 cell line derived transforming sequence like n=1 Tax=Naja naja TaxID=35670 RepID=A0A8C6YC09_NAJNA
MNFYSKVQNYSIPISMELIWVCLVLDEIMHQDIVPLCAEDIEDELRKKFAYLSGRDGSPVITFPEFSTFSEIPEKEFQVSFSLPFQLSSQDAGIGFILVIDRRQDKWTSVFLDLRLTSFPGNLQLVLVLRPTGFFHRTLFDIAYSFHGDDYKIKLPIIMLSSLTELNKYIDTAQLTEDLGGSLDYCHNRWLTERTAIESFARMVKQIAQTLQSFGNELAEEELPNDAQATSYLLATHTERRDKMKVQCLIQNFFICLFLLRLLSQLDETEAAFDDFWCKHQQKLEQCLQLRHFELDFKEVKTALDSVSEKLFHFTEMGNSSSHVEHILKDLASFEEKSQEVLEKASLLISSGNQFIENKHYAVDSILPKCSELQQHYEMIISEVNKKRDLLNHSFELHRQLEKCMKWCDDGIYLLASQPVDKCQSQDGAEAALQEIEQFLDLGDDNRLRELSYLSKEFEAIFTEELMERVQKVFQKQNNMEEMIQKRQVSLKKLAAKQTRPVQPVAPRPEGYLKSSCPYSGKKPISQGILFYEINEMQQSRNVSVTDDEENLAVLRKHVMNELLETERAYVEELLCVLEGYAAEMDNPLMAHLISPGLQNKKDVLFGNMEEIYHFHNRIFLREIEDYIDCPQLIGRCFFERMKDFKIYEKYCQNKPRSESLWRQCSDSAFFQECQRKLDHKLSLDSYLLKPVQRITKYQLLLKEMLKYSKNCEGAEDLQVALTSILGILKAVNDSMHQIAITGYEGNLNELGKLLMQGSFNVWIDHKKGHSKVKDLARFKPMQRHLFLHEKAILFCKKREENGEGYEKAPSYSFKNSLNMTAVGITENVKGDIKKFEIWYNAREEVYIIQAATPEIKATWVNEIRKVLTSQLQACRRKLSLSHQSPRYLRLSPSKNEGRHLRKREMRNADSPDGCVSSVASKNLEKSRGKFKSFSWNQLEKLCSKWILYFYTKTLCVSVGLCVREGGRERDRENLKSLLIIMILMYSGWSKTSQSLDASEENDGWSSAEDPLNSSDAEEEGKGEKKLVPGKYTVVATYDKGNSNGLILNSGELVQLIHEGADGLWYLRNLSTNKEGWVPINILIPLLSNSKSAFSLSSSGKIRDSL